MALRKSDIAAKFAELYAQNLRNNVACDLGVYADQSATVSCNSSSILAYRNSQACRDAIMSNSPDQTMLCNPCAIVDAKQSMIINVTAQCGSSVLLNTIAQMKPYLGDMYNKIHGLSADNGANSNVISAYNNVASYIGNEAFAASITQALIARQNITVTTATGAKSGIFQTTVVDIVMRQFLTVTVLDDLAAALNAAPVDPVVSTPAIVVTLPVSSTPAPTSASNMTLALQFMALFIIIVALVWVFIRLKSNDRRDVSQQSLPTNV